MFLSLYAGELLAEPGMHVLVYGALVLMAVMGALALVFAGIEAFTVLTIPAPPAFLARKPEEWGLQPRTVTIGAGEAWFFAHRHSQRLILLIHGHNRSKEWMVPLAQTLSAHANVLAIDLPAHGSMWPGLCTFGVRESYYVNEAIHWAERSGFEHVLLVGHSMGGSSALLAVCQQPREIVDGIATIGSYGSIEAVYRGISDHLHLPQGTATQILDVGSHLAGYDYRQAAPLECIGELRVPYLVIHGRSDDLVPPDEARKLAAASGGPTSLVWYAGGHDEPENPALGEAIVRFVQVLDEQVSEPTMH